MEPCAPGPFPVPSKQLNPVGPGHGWPIPPLLQEFTPHLSLYDLILHTYPCLFSEAEWERGRVKRG